MLKICWKYAKKKKKNERRTKNKNKNKNKKKKKKKSVDHETWPPILRGTTKQMIRIRKKSNNIHPESPPNPLGNDENPDSRRIITKQCFVTPHPMCYEWSRLEKEEEEQEEEEEEQEQEEEQHQQQQQKKKKKKKKNNNNNINNNNKNKNQNSRRRIWDV